MRIRPVYGRPRYLAALVALAAVQFASGSMRPETVDLGPLVGLVPTATVSQSYDDNIFSQSSGTESSWITGVKPKMQLVAKHNADVFAVTYLGDYAIYEQSAADDYYNHTLSADALIPTGARGTFKLGVSTAALHDNRGTGSSEGTVALSRPEPDRYHMREYNGTWDFGVSGAPFALRLSANRTAINYVNNQVATAFRDRTDNGFSARLYRRGTGRIRLYVELGRKNVAYNVLPLYGPSLDSHERSGYFGAEWEITGKTTGSGKIGYVSKDFDAPSRGDDQLISWHGQVSWKPKSYSTVTLAIERRPEETNGTGSVIESSTNSLAWEHDWRSYLHSHVSVGFGTDAYGSNPRRDTRRFYSAGVSYDLHRWMNLSASFSHDGRNSNVAQYDYGRNVYAFSISMSL